MKPNPATVYRGHRSADGLPRVSRDGLPFDPAPSQRRRNHSPDGFEWGYGGSGPAQLALAILLDVTGDARRAEDLHQDFKWDFVARWGFDGWSVTGGEVLGWLAKRPAAA